MGTIATYLQQLLQPKICSNKMLYSMRKNDLIKDHFESIKNESLENNELNNNIENVLRLRKNYVDKI